MVVLRSGGWFNLGFIDLAKIGLANGQPGSDTKVVRTEIPGYYFPSKLVLVLTSSQDFC